LRRGNHPDPIKAFTLTFDNVAYDEGPIAKEMAALAGAEYHPIPIGQNDLADNFADAIAQAETACVNAHGVAKYLLSRAVRDAGYKVVGFGRNLWRLSALPAGHPALQPRRPRSAGHRGSAALAQRAQYGEPRAAAARR
jgi:hypothetical protein